MNACVFPCECVYSRKYTGIHGNARNTGTHRDRREYTKYRTPMYSCAFSCTPVYSCVFPYVPVYFRVFPCIHVYSQEHKRIWSNTQEYKDSRGNKWGYTGIQFNTRECIRQIHIGLHGNNWECTGIHGRPFFCVFPCMSMYCCALPLILMYSNVFS